MTTSYTESFRKCYDIYNKGQNNIIEIEWNLTTKDGHIKDSLYFSDEN